MTTVSKIKVGGTTYDIAYPVGSIYLSVNNTSPAELFGGTWEQIKDRFLLAAGNTYAAGSTGGEAQHTLTRDELPPHNHLIYADGNSDFKLLMGDNANFEPGAGISHYTVETKHDPTKGFEAMASVVGGSQPHNNMPPYLAVYMWKRIA